MNQTIFGNRRRVRRLPLVIFVFSLLLALLILGGCEKRNRDADESTESASHTETQEQSVSDTDSRPQTESDADTDEPPQSAVPSTLEEELLTKRGIAFTASDYKSLVGGEGLLDFGTVFADLDPEIAGGDLSSVFLSGGKIYKFNCDTPLSGGNNFVQVGTLPVSSKPIYFHTSDFNGADIDIIFEGGGRFRLDAPSNNGPYAAKESQYGMIYFEHTYIYSQDGKSLDEISDFRSRISRFDASIVIADGKLYSYATRQVKDNISDSPLYFDDREKGVIIIEANCSAMGSGEKIVTMFNGNILVTDKAFYKIVYDDVPDNLTDYSQKVTNSDGSTAEYLPRFGGGDKYRLVKIDLLTKYYDEVLSITPSYAITKDFKALPLTEIIPAENKYASYGFGDIEIPEDVSRKIN